MESHDLSIITVEDKMCGDESKDVKHVKWPQYSLLYTGPSVCFHDLKQRFLKGIDAQPCFNPDYTQTLIL